MQLPLDRITAVLDDLTEQAKIIDAENQHTKSHYLLKDKDIFSEPIETGPRFKVPACWSRDVYDFCCSSFG